MTRRREPPERTKADLLERSRRRCCMCYALEVDSQEKGGQIAHLDHDPSNNRLGNLAWLCLPHHDQ